MSNDTLRMRKQRRTPIILPWSEYVAVFTRIYRQEAEKLSEQQKAIFQEHTKEWLLTKPCQIEMFDLNNPYRLIWLFVFDKTKPDLTISITKENWKNINTHIKNLEDKYSRLEFDHTRMVRLFNYFFTMKNEYLFATDVFSNAIGICFPRDIRSECWRLTPNMSPQEVAKVLFYLNYTQTEALGVRSTDAEWKALGPTDYEIL